MNGTIAPTNQEKAGTDDAASAFGALRVYVNVRAVRAVVRECLQEQNNELRTILAPLPHYPSGSNCVGAR